MSKQALINRCKELNCLAIDNGDNITVDAPSGYLFRGVNQHSITEQYGDRRGRQPKAEAYKSLIQDLKNGLRPCLEPDCDSCYPVVTFQEIVRLYPGEVLYCPPEGESLPLANAG